MVWCSLFILDRIFEPRKTLNTRKDRPLGDSQKWRKLFRVFRSFRGSKKQRIGLIGSVVGAAQRDGFEFFGQIGQRFLDRHAL